MEPGLASPVEGRGEVLLAPVVGRPAETKAGDTRMEVGQHDVECTVGGIGSEVRRKVRDQQRRDAELALGPLTTHNHTAQQFGPVGPTLDDVVAGRHVELDVDGALSMGGPEVGVSNVCEVIRGS